MGPFIAFFLIIFIGLFSSTLLRKLHFPWVVALILGGIVIGPQGINILNPDSTIEFISQLGLIFLMFMAGLETKLESFKDSGKKLFLLGAINGLVPMIIGMGIGYAFGYNLTTIFMIGTVFVSSSIAVVIPTLEANKLFNMKIGKAVMTTSIIQDVASLVLLSVLLQNIKPTSNIPLVIFYPFLAVTIITLRFALPRIKNFLSSLTPKKDDLLQEELRSIMLILVGTVILFELLGLHSIIGGFFAGLVLSDTITDEVLIGKIRAISYGIFIPVFFVFTGLSTNVAVLFNIDNALLLVLLIVLGSIVSKLFSGIIGAKLVGFSNVQSVFFGASSVPQLSTTLAVSYTANSLGIISNELHTSFVALSIVSTMVGPIIMSKFSRASLTTGLIERVGINIAKQPLIEK